jgi:hypothetical protein
MRSALDLAAVSVGRLCGVEDTSAIHFPFCKAAIDMKSRLNSACKKLPEDIKSLFGSFQPYRGGDDLLWAINEAANTSKHDLIAPLNTAANVNVTRLVARSGGGGRRFYWQPVVIAGPNNEITFAITERGLNPYYEIQVAVGIIFGHVEVIGGREVFPILKAMHQRVVAIVNKTESECQKLGLIT